MTVLRIPPAIAFTMVAGTATLGGLACDHGKAPQDARNDGNTQCIVFCIPDTTSDAGVCPENPPCAEPPDFTCPPGCRPVG